MTDSSINLRSQAREKIRKARRDKDKELSLFNLNLTEIPKGIQELFWLEKLTLSSNNLSNVNNLSSLTKLQTLNLYGNKLLDISGLSNLIGLQTLHLTENRLLDISALSGLVNLQILYLDKNQLSNVSTLSTLISLRELDISSNQLSDIPTLPRSIQKLFLNDNRLSDISALSNLIDLQDLELRSNQLSDVSALSKLTGLHTLDLRNNQLSNVSNLSNLQSLRNLDLRDNNLSNVSALSKIIEKIGISWKQAHYTISVNNNPLINPPPEIIQQGKIVILQYLESIKSQSSSELYEAKLLILGEGGSGKTTLFRKLQDAYAAMPKEDESTEGIDIHRLSFNIHDYKRFTINLWDFGGQEIYHATHQFFLSKRSLYILIADNREENTDFKYWLQIIELLGGESPVIIVQNEKSRRKKKLDISSLKTRFGNIREVVSLDLKNDIAGIRKLYKTIQFHVQRLPHVGDILPESWFNIRQKLEKISNEQPFIELKRYYQICNEENIKEELSMLILSRYLHDLGVFLHFQDDAILRRMLILQNEWATNGVYNILDNGKVIEQKGEFTRSDAEGIWSTEKRYEDRYEELLRLMMKFELCYRIRNIQAEKYIAPQLLEASKPDYEWNDVDSLILEYHYGFMPKGLMSRFIVRMQRYVKNTKTMWRKGVILERRNTNAEIIEDYTLTTISIRITGQYKKEFMTIITEDLDELNETFGEKLKVEKYVPCNCRKCKGSTKPHFFTHENLIRRKEKGKPTVECDISYEYLNVIELLDSIFAVVNVNTKKLFISYSKKDVEYLNTFKNHLSPLNRNEKVVTWDDQDLIPGEKWNQRIRYQLDNADVIVLLVSSDFMATNYVMNVEVARAIERHNVGKVILIPIILRPCVWENQEFAKLKVLPTKGKPITLYSDEDTAWREVVEEIKSVLSLPKGE